MIFRKWSIGYNKFCSPKCSTILSVKDGTNGYINHARARALPILTKKCVWCGEEFTTKLEDRVACSKSCGAHYNQSRYTEEQRIEASKKRQEYCLEKYGDRYVVNSRYTREKTKEKTGYEYAYQDPKVLSGIRDRYFEKHGVKNPLQRPEIREKMMKTRVERYGSMLAPCYKYKTYTFPSGRTAKLQGYEPKAIDILLKTHEESDIVVGRKEILKYVDTLKYNLDGKEHQYFPDIYVISEKKIIEVKSKFTYEKHSNTNELKKSCVEQRGFKFEFMILDR